MNSELSTDIASAAGLDPADRATVLDLCEVFRRRRARNGVRSAYYEMHRRARDLGISVPPSLRTLEQVIGWPAKAVDSLAARSQFDGFTCADEGAQEQLASVVRDCGLKRRYRKLVKSELEHCCSFMTVTAGDAAAGEPPVVISAYPATAAAALWDYGRNRIRAGIVIVDTDRDGEPTAVNVFTDSKVIELSRAARRGWSASEQPISMGRCLMEPLAYDATLERPFGRSRITRAVMNLTDDAMRASLRSEVSAEFFTAPQKYLLGADGDALGDMSKWDAYIGSIFAVSKDGDGDVPKFGQLPQGTMQPHIDYMRSLAARFSGETNVPLSELGVVTDNPASAEAIYAAKESMIVDAQNLNADNAEALRDVALMALAVLNGTDFATERSRGLAIQPKFRNPSMPSVVSQADAMLKMVQAIPWLADSDVALEELGFSDDQMLRLRPIRDRFNARALVAGAVGGTGLKVASNPDLDVG